MNVIVKKLSEMRAQTLGEWLEELIQWQENQDSELGIDRWMDDGGQSKPRYETLVGLDFGGLHENRCIIFGKDKNLIRHNKTTLSQI